MHPRKYIVRAATTLACVVALTCCAGPAAAAALFQPLGTLPGGTESRARGVSPDGSTVVGYSRLSAGPFDAFVWTRSGGMRSIGDGSLSSSAAAASADGSVVVGFGAAGTRAFRWTAAAGMEYLTTAHVNPGAAYAVSRDGSVVAGNDSLNAFRWTEAGGLQSLGMGTFPSATDAWGMSADGSVVVGRAQPARAGYEAFRWTESTGTVGLGVLPGGWHSEATAASADGSVVVGRSNTSDARFHAVRWTAEGGMQSLDGAPCGTMDSHAAAVSADGSVVTGMMNIGFAPGQAFIWDEQRGLRNLRDRLVTLGLNLDGWTLTEATGISADGTVLVGHGVNSAGATEAWLAVVPEPSTAGVLLISAAALAAGRTVRARRARPAVSRIDKTRSALSGWGMTGTALSRTSGRSSVTPPRIDWWPHNDWIADRRTAGVSAKYLLTADKRLTLLLDGCGSKYL